MKIKDRYGTVVNLYQAKNGKIMIPIANQTITLSKADAETFDLCSIEDFDEDLYKKAYS